MILFAFPKINSTYYTEDGLGVVKFVHYHRVRVLEIAMQQHDSLICHCAIMSGCLLVYSRKQ